MQCCDGIEAVLIRCITDAISPNPEKLSLSRTLSIDALVVGKDYNVLGIYLQPENELFRRTLRFTIEVEDNIVSSVPSAFFSILDRRMQEVWQFFERDDGSITIHPPEFEGTNFMERLANNDEDTIMTFNKIKSTMNL